MAFFDKIAPPAALILTVLSAACDPGTAHGEGPRRSTTATDVEIQVPFPPDSTLVMTGKRLTMGEDDIMSLEGDASISLEGPSPMSARARRVTLEAGERIVLDGRVRASFEIPDPRTPDGGGGQ